MSFDVYDLLILNQIKDRAEIIQFLIGQIQAKPLTLKSLREFVPSFVGMVFGNSSNKIE
jgi:hypothetical protein